MFLPAVELENMIAVRERPPECMKRMISRWAHNKAWRWRDGDERAPPKHAIWTEVLWRIKKINHRLLIKENGWQMFLQSFRTFFYHPRVVLIISTVINPLLPFLLRFLQVMGYCFLTVLCYPECRKNMAEQEYFFTSGRSHIALYGTISKCKTVSRRF